MNKKEARIRLTDINEFSHVGLIKQEILFNGPVVAVMDANEDFLSYTGGIYNTEGKFFKKLTVILIGWGKTSEDEYWIGRTDFKNWGDIGYFKIPFNFLNIDKEVYSFETFFQ